MRRIISFLILITFLAGLSPSSFAGVSTSAVLFLRIAAGARAAGMGEAFVAVADDATATHWNPAGLGTYPLSSKWFEVNIPENLRPLKKITLFQNDAAETDYNKFDIWAISEKGLVRFSRDKWYRGEIIETHPDQSSESILRDYTGLISDEHDKKVDKLLDIIGDANNDYPREVIDSLEQKVMSNVAEDLDNREELENAFYALTSGYNQCLVDWERFKKIEEDYRDCIRDSLLSKSDVDKILFSVERAKRRFLPEEITIPYEVNFEGTLTDIAADKKNLWITSDSGLYRYDSKRWRRFTSTEGLPANSISSIKLYGKQAYLGTNYGLVIYDAGAFSLQDDYVGLPSKPISGVAVESDSTAWAVVEGDLYHFNGSVWQNYFEYNDFLDQPAESIYENMKIFDTPREKADYFEKYGRMNEVAPVTIDLSKKETLKGATGLIDSVGLVSALQILQDSLSKTETVDKPALGKSVEELKSIIDSVGIVEELQMAQDSATKPVAIDTTKPPKTKADSIGRLIKIPYTAGIPFEITAMEVDQKGDLWIGTEYGLMRFDGRTWRRYGYRDYTAEKDMDINNLALSLVGGDTRRSGRLAANIKAVNMLQSDSLYKGQVVKVYSNPAGARIQDICLTDGKIFFATESGTILLGNRWARYNEEELGRLETSAIEVARGNMWFATYDKIKIKAGARAELAMMHVNWLPELADDIYYEFFSYVRNIEGWGTVGGNITFLSYGSITRTDATGNVLGEFSAFDFAMTLSYGTSLSSSLSGGLSAKIIYSHLSEQGAGEEKGSGTSTGLALDIGLLYKLHHRVALGMALTNVGPAISYIDVAQSDPLPRNLAVGLAWTAIETNYSNLLFTIEGNKSMVAIGGFKDELKEVVLNGGMEYWYGSFIAFRAGYVYDQEGDIKTPTLGFGLAYSSFKFDFAYIPSSENVPLANTMRLSLGVNF